jgi:hypothetical protein
MTGSGDIHGNVSLLWFVALLMRVIWCKLLVGWQAESITAGWPGQQVVQCLLKGAVPLRFLSRHSALRTGCMKISWL